MAESDTLSEDTLRYRLAKANKLCGTCRKRDATHGTVCSKCQATAYQRRCIKSPRKRKNFCGNCFREGHNARTCTLTEEEGSIARERAVELAEDKGSK